MKIDAKRVPMIINALPDGTLSHQEAQLDQLAYVIAKQRHPELFPNLRAEVVQSSALAGIQFSQQRTLRFRVDPGEGAFFSLRIREEYQPIGDLMTAEAYLSQMPERDRAILETKILKIVKSMTPPAAFDARLATL